MPQDVTETAHAIDLLCFNLFKAIVLWQHPNRMAIESNRPNIFLFLWKTQWNQAAYSFLVGQVCEPEMFIRPATPEVSVV